MAATRDDTRPSVRAQAAEWVRGAFTENPVPKIVAFFLALAIFILVQSDEGVFVGDEVRVEYKLPADRVLKNPPPPQITVTVKGTRRQTRRFNGKEVGPIKIDLSNHQGSTFLLEERMLRLPEGLSLVSFNPASIPTDFEERIEKQVPIDPYVRGPAPTGFTPGSIRIKPDQAKISGADSAVAAITAVRTREISLAGRRESFVQAVPLEDPGPLIDIVEPQIVNVEVDVVEEQGSRKLGAIPVEVRHGDVKDAISARYTTRPEQVQVTLRGTRLAIDALAPNTLVAYVQLFNDDVASRRTRQARVIVPKPAPGIAVEINPEEVTIVHK